MDSLPTTGQIVLAANQKNYPFKTGPCDWIVCRSATGDVFVTLKKRQRAVLTVPLSGAASYEAPQEFDEIAISDRSGSENTVEIWFGRGKYTASQNGINVNIDQLVAGEVDVVNQPTVTVDDGTPIAVQVPGEVTVNGTVSLDDSDPINVEFAANPTVIVDDSTPIDVNLASGSVTLNQSNISNGGADLADASITGNSTIQVITGNAANVRVRIGVPEDNTQSIRIGTHSAVDSDTGTIVPPGGYWESNTAADVYVHMLGATNESVTRELETRT